MATWHEDLPRYIEERGEFREAQRGDVATHVMMPIAVLNVHEGFYNVVVAERNLAYRQLETAHEKLDAFLAGGMSNVSVDQPTTNPFADGRSETPDCQGYHPVAVLLDGELLCEHCVIDPTNPVIDGTDERWPLADTAPEDVQWTVISWATSETFTDDECSHCGRRWVDDD